MNNFCSHVIVRYFEEIKWSLSKVAWTPVNHCWIDGFLNKMNWNNKWIALKKWSKHMDLLLAVSSSAHCLWSGTAPQVIAVIQFTWSPGHKGATNSLLYSCSVPASWLFLRWLLMVLKFCLVLRKDTCSCPRMTVSFEGLLFCGTKVS